MTFLYFVMLISAGAFGVFFAALGGFLLAGRFLRSIINYGAHD